MIECIRPHVVCGQHHMIMDVKVRSRLRCGLTLTFKRMPFKRMSAHQARYHVTCAGVAESLHACNIEHSPTPSLIPKPPRRCLKVWLCPPTVPLRHRPRASTGPHRAPHPASLLPPSRGLPSGPRQPPVSAGSSPGPFPAMPPCLRI